jgi:hypothetical protein
MVILIFINIIFIMRVNIDISQIQKVVQMLVEEEGQESVVITPDQYINFLKFTNYNGKLVQNMKQFRGKRIVINGDLSLRNTDANNITNITVNGGLDLSYTLVNSIEGVKSTYISTYGTPYEKIQIKKQRQIELAKQNDLRQEDEWNLETATSDIAITANVLFEFLTSSSGLYEAKEPNHDARLQQLYAEKERMEEIERETEDNENLMDLEAVEEEIEYLELRIDVYNLVYAYKYYNMRVFYVLTGDLEESKERWAVGDNYDTHMSAYEKIDELIDDIGIKGFNQSFVEDYIDVEELKETFREDEESNVRENLEDFFNEEDFEYSDPAVQERIDEINKMLEDSENLSQEQYNELNEELDELKDSDKTIPEDLIEDKVEDLVNDLVDDPMTTIQNYGLEIENYMDTQGFKEGLLRSDGIGHTLNTYDGDYDTIEFNDETYYILQIEG